MYRLYKTSAIALFALLAFVPNASAQRHAVIVQRPPVVIVERPFFWGPGWGWYDPYYPWCPPYAYQYTGDVKLVSPIKNASVYIDGGYAGIAGKLKKFSLPPGTHDISLRDNEGRTFFHEKVQVIAGRTTKINAGYPG